MLVSSLWLIVLFKCPIFLPNFCLVVPSIIEMRYWSLYLLFLNLIFLPSVIFCLILTLSSEWSFTKNKSDYVTPLQSSFMPPHMPHSEFKPSTPITSQCIPLYLLLLSGPADGQRPNPSVAYTSQTLCLQDLCICCFLCLKSSYLSLKGHLHDWLPHFLQIFAFSQWGLLSLKQWCLITSPFVWFSPPQHLSPSVIMHML